MDDRFSMIYYGMDVLFIMFHMLHDVHYILWYVCYAQYSMVYLCMMYDVMYYGMDACMKCIIYRMFVMVCMDKYTMDCMYEIQCIYIRVCTKYE